MHGRQLTDDHKAWLVDEMTHGKRSGAELDAYYNISKGSVARWAKLSSDGSHFRKVGRPGLVTHDDYSTLTENVENKSMLTTPAEFKNHFWILLRKSYRKNQLTRLHR